MYSTGASKAQTRVNATLGTMPVRFLLAVGAHDVPNALSILWLKSSDVLAEKKRVSAFCSGLMEPLFVFSRFGIYESDLHKYALELNAMRQPRQLK